MRTPVILSLLATIVNGYGQGTIIFHNRDLTNPADPSISYNASFRDFCESSHAQLFLVTGFGASLSFTPLFPTQNFRPFPNDGTFIDPVLVTVPGIPAGTTGVRVVVRAWEGAGTYDNTPYRGESNIVTVGPLGGIPETGPQIAPPNLYGLQNFTLLAPNPACIPEPSALALALLGSVSLLFRKR